MEWGTTVAITWRGRRVDAFVPAPMPRTLDYLSASYVRRRGRPHPSSGSTTGWTTTSSLARLLLRAEGVASSHIEGVRAPAEHVAVAQIDSGAVDVTSAWVADNLAVVDAALEHARSDAALTAEDLHRWHARLMAHGGALPDELVGRFRRMQNWIGGATPWEAAYVPPPAEHVGRLMTDLVRATNTSKPVRSPSPPSSMPSSKQSIPTATAMAGWVACSSVGSWLDAPMLPYPRR